MKNIPAFYFNRVALASRVARLRKRFAKATPFSHVVLDDFLPAGILKLLIREFPGADSPIWDIHGAGRTLCKNDKDIDKLGSSNEEGYGDFTRHFIAQLNSKTFLDFIEKVSGVKNLIADPSYNDCGLHSTGPGGRLMIHTDLNRHPFSGNRPHQILNAILYLNEDWQESYGGHLELWKSRTEGGKKILPIANRLVLFHTGTRSFHGHPKPLTCPADRRRNSIAVYYYVMERPSDEAYEGMQVAVDWVPTEKADFAFIAERRKIFVSWISKYENCTCDFPGEYLQQILQAEPGPNAAAASGAWKIKFLNWKTIRGKKAFVKKHLQAFAKSRPADFIPGRYTPFAVAESGKTSASKRRRLTFLVDTEGMVHVCAGPKAKVSQKFTYFEVFQGYFAQA